MATRDDSSTYRSNCAWCGRRTEVGPVVEEDQDGKQIVSDVCFDCFPDDETTTSRTEPVTHYYADCGGPVHEDDVSAAEPWGITCPACAAMIEDDQAEPADH